MALIFIASGAPTHNAVTNTDSGGRKGWIAAQRLGRDLHSIPRRGRLVQNEKYMTKQNKKSDAANWEIRHIDELITNSFNRTKKR